MKAAIFYAGYEMVAYTDPGWIQLVFDMLTGLFYRLGLRTKVQKTVGMVCQPCRAAGVRADKGYNRRIIGEGRSFKER